MKTLVCLLALLGTSLFALAQTDQPNLSELKEEYFDEREDALSTLTKKISAEKQQILDALLAKMKALDAESFEYNFALYVNGNYNTELDEALFRAYALESNDEDVLKEMLGFYIITTNTAKQKEFLTKVQKFYTPAELAYYTDALPSSKSILFASNQEDMYGFLLAQQVNGAGTDVQVVNLDFMKNDAYRETISTITGIPDVPFTGNEKVYLRSMLQTTSKKVYISSTVPQEYLSLLSDNVYITGLSYQYGNVDQATALNSFWSKVKTKDLSQISLSSYAEKFLYANYLPPLITLYMMQQSDLVLKSTIQSIALKIGKADEVNEILKSIETD
jgi:hypothetical protein